MHVHHGTGVEGIAFGELLMAAACGNSRRIAGILAACALTLTVFSGQQAHAKDKSLKGELEQALVGQVVTSKILLGDRARPTDLVRQGITWDLPVHTLVEAETGEIRYRVEDRLLLERPDVSPGEMGPSFRAGTSFRISAINFKDDRLEIRLKQISGRTTEVKLMLGKGWQSRYDAASVQAKLGLVFTSDQSGQREVEAEQAPPQAKPVETPTQSPVPAAQVETATQSTTPVTPIAAAESPANRVPLPPNPLQQPEQHKPATPESARPAFIDCNAVQHIALFSLPDASSSPVATLQCGEKVLALGQQQDWARVRTQQGVEGYAYGGYVSYGKPSSAGQATEGQPESSPEVTPSQRVEDYQPTARTAPEPPARPPSLPEVPSRFALTAGYLVFAMMSIIVALASRRASEADSRSPQGRLIDTAENVVPHREGTQSHGDLYNAAVCYLTGCGKKQSTRMAYSLLASSAQAGNKEAEEVLAAAGAAPLHQEGIATSEGEARVLTILLGLVLAAIGCGIVAALLGCLGLWTTS
jgi:hypothetical protein